MQRKRASGERLQRRKEFIPPPYKAIRPVLDRSCLSRPFRSTACWHMTSPVAKRTYGSRVRHGSERQLLERCKPTAVVTDCVRIGREASFIWYLTPRYHQPLCLIANSTSIGISGKAYHLNMIVVSGARGDDNLLLLTRNNVL